MTSLKAEVKQNYAKYFCWRQRIMQSDSALGRAIQVRRAELGLKRKDLARLASLSYPYVSELENGSKAPSAKALAQLADALQLSPADLMALAEAMPPSAPA